MSAAVAYDRLAPRVGEELGRSRQIIVTQAMIDQFAQITQDEQWIHLDPARAARETPFGGTVAHGFLTLSFASRFAYDVIPPEPGQAMSINYGFDRLRFVAPVQPGDAIEGAFVLKAVKLRKPTELLRTHQLTIEIKGQHSPALVAEWLSLAIFETS